MNQEQSKCEMCCMQDCGIPDGATLKLVLAMRGGPINTRKIILPEDTAKERSKYIIIKLKNKLMICMKIVYFILANWLLLYY